MAASELRDLEESCKVAENRDGHKNGRKQAFGGALGGRLLLMALGATYLLVREDSVTETPVPSAPTKGSYFTDANPRFPRARQEENGDEWSGKEP